MNHDRLEQLLKGYRLPEVSRDLDRRTLAEMDAILARARRREIVEDVGHSLLHRLGFGYLAWLVDLVTATDAEYDVVVI